MTFSYKNRYQDLVFEDSLQVATSVVLDILATCPLLTSMTLRHISNMLWVTAMDPPPGGALAGEIKQYLITLHGKPARPGQTKSSPSVPPAEGPALIVFLGLYPKGTALPRDFLSKTHFSKLSYFSCLLFSVLIYFLTYLSHQTLIPSL